MSAAADYYVIRQILMRRVELNGILNLLVNSFPGLVLAWDDFYLIDIMPTHRMLLLALMLLFRLQALLLRADNHLSVRLALLLLVAARFAGIPPPFAPHHLSETALTIVPLRVERCSRH